MSDSKNYTGAEPHDFYSPHTSRSLNRSNQYYKDVKDVPYFPGQTYAPFDPASRQGQEATMGLAGQAGGELSKTLSGGYLDPTQDPRYRFAMDDIENRVGSRFAAANRLGSGAFFNAMTDAEAAGAASLYGEERNRMGGAVGMAGLPGGLMQGVGAQREGKVQQGLSEDFNRYETDVGRSRERDALGVYNQAVNSSPYRDLPQTPYYTNPYMEGLGYANAGIGTLSSLQGLFGGGGGGGQGGGYSGGYVPQLDPRTIAFMGGR